MADKNEDYYVSPSDFFDAMIEARQQGKITERLSKIFALFAEKTANHRFWIRYNHLREDIIAENVYACVKGFEAFSPYRDKNKEWKGEDVEYHHTTCNNPHSWFTTCCFNNLKQFMGKQYNQENIRNKMRVNMGLEPSHSYADAVEAMEAKKQSKIADEENDVDNESEPLITWD